jgi:uncharacterized protein (TIGR03066 family)
MKVVILLTAAWLALCSSSSSAQDKQARDLLAGKWQSTDEKDKGVIVEFKTDGAVKITFGAGGLSFVIDGAYKLIDDKTVEVTMTDLNKKGEKKTEKLSIKTPSDGECILVDGKGKEMTLKRMAVAKQQPKDFKLGD